MTFPVAFREHVIPALRPTARVQGLFFALGRRSFSEAYAAVFEIARERGAMHLPDDIFAALEGWIAEEILSACTEFEPSVEERRVIADRVAADIAICEALWGTTT